MKTKRLLILLLLICALAPGLFAQRGSVAAGGESSGSGGKISYSIGQVDFISSSGSGGSSNQGLQQPFTITEETGIEVKSITLNFAVYPVPTLDNVSLNVTGNEFGKLRYTLISMDGKLLLDQEVLSDITIVQMREYTQGLYKLNVYDSDNKLIKSFNLIKN